MQKLIHFFRQKIKNLEIGSQQKLHLCNSINACPHRQITCLTCLRMKIPHIISKSRQQNFTISIHFLKLHLLVNKYYHNGNTKHKSHISVLIRFGLTAPAERAYGFLRKRALVVSSIGGLMRNCFKGVGYLLIFTLLAMVIGSSWFER